MQIRQVDKIPETKRRERIEGEPNPQTIQKLRELHNELKEQRITPEQYRQQRDKTLQEA